MLHIHNYYKFCKNTKINQLVYLLDLINLHNHAIFIK